jgi:hypothetical protein
MIAYKYRDATDRSLEIIKNCNLYYATPSQLNDPLDSQINIDAEYQKLLSLYPPHHSEEYLKKSFLIHILNQHNYYDHKGKNIGLNGAMQLFLAKLGILSLSTNPTDALLWSHYANGHTGIAIGFETDLIKESFIKGKVKYAKDPPYQKLFLDLSEKIAVFVKPWEKDHHFDAKLGDNFYTHQISQLMRANLLTKSRKWKYESEYRMVNTEPGEYKFSPEALKSITFGLKTSSDYVRKVLQALNNDSYSHVKINYLSHRVGSFDFELVKYCESELAKDIIT